MSLEVASSSLLSLPSNSQIPASTETTYTIILTNNTSSTITDQRLLTFTFDYFDTLESGSQFNKDIKTLAGDSNPPTTATENTSIKAIKVVNTLPNNVQTIDVSASKNGWIKAYFDNGTIYLYTILPKIILNKSSNYLFHDLTKVTEIDTKNFDTSKVTSMGCMFYKCSSLTSLDVSNFDTSNVTDMDSMFYGCHKLTSLDVSKFDTTNVTSMSDMFYGCSSLTSLDLSNFDTSNVTNMSWMFEGCSSLTSLDVSKFDTSKVTSMNSMFYRCSKLKTIYASNKFDTSKVSNSSGMFSSCTSLVGGNGTTYNSSYIDKTYARIDSSSTPGYFTSKS